MSCEHKRIKSENCVISCLDCGKILPFDYLVAQARIKEQAKQAETAPEGPGTDENPTNEADAAKTAENGPENANVTEPEQTPEEKPEEIAEPDPEPEQEQEQESDPEPEQEQESEPEPEPEKPAKPARGRKPKK